MQEIHGAEAPLLQRFIQALVLHKGMGSESPHLTNTVGIENPVVGESQSLGATLRRQDGGSSEMRVGRPAVTEDIDCQEWLW